MIKLNILRNQRNITQSDLADKMKASQGTVSRLESNDTDPRVSTVRAYVKALGGDLELIARFGGCSYILDVEKEHS